MAIQTTNILTTDIYLINEYIEAIKQKYIDIPEDTLMMGVYGYLSSIHSNLLENASIMASEYSNEAIPTRAKYERNVIAHALALGINDIMATPATIDVVIALPEESLLSNMQNGKFTLDKEFVYYIGERENYPYLLDYDVVISRDLLPNGSYVYNARYDIDGKNVLSTITNPYLPAVGRLQISGDNLIAITTTLRQVTHTQINKKIIVNNPLENMVINFSFEDQLAYFYVDVVEDNETHYLIPMYDGLYSTTDQEYINYLYLDENNIRLRFNRESYQPRQNAEVTIHVYTTLGSECNFELNEFSKIQPLVSERFPYNGLYSLVLTDTDSIGGEDKKTVDDLKIMIPKEAISRGSVTTYTDLQNAFNHANDNDEECKLYFLERVHNQKERIFFCYLLMKDGNNVIPTNTIKARVDRGMFSSISKDNFSIKPGALYYLDPDSGDDIVGKTTTDDGETGDKEIANWDESGFLYMNPYLMIINKSPFYVSYYHVLVNYTRLLYFEFINDKSILQFVSMSFYVHRDFYTDPGTYKIELKATQNINSDFDLLTYEEDGVTVKECKFAIYGILYNVDNEGQLSPTRYIKSEFVSFDEGNAEFTFVFKFKTNDVISGQDTFLTITDGMYPMNTTVAPTSTFIKPNVYIKFFYLVKLDEDYGRMYGDNLTDNLDDLIPGLEGWTLTNIYNAGDAGLDIFYDYTDIVQSFINMTKGDDGMFTYTIHKMPVVRRTYLNTEERIVDLFHKIDIRRRYIQNILFLLEDSFGIDYKFFNTYGKSYMYNIEGEENIDRINLSLRFEIKFQVDSDRVILSQITNSIKEYIEDLNHLTDLHIPNLITYITNLYRQQLVYIKFIQLNQYDSLYQSIYKNPEIDEDYFLETQTVPEFINVNTLNNDLPDIEYIIKS